MRLGLAAAPLALGLSAFLLVACVVTELLRKMLGPAATALIDAPIVSCIASHRVGWLTAAMREITRLGSDGFLLAVTVIVGSILRNRTGSWRPLLILVAIAVGAVSIEKILKLAIARPRPPVSWMAVSAFGGSFPSGHATHSAAVYSGAACLTTCVRLPSSADAILWICSFRLIRRPRSSSTANVEANSSKTTSKRLRNEDPINPASLCAKDDQVWFKLSIISVCAS